MKAYSLVIALMLIAADAPLALGLAFTDETLLPHNGAVGKAYRFQLKGRAGSAPYHFKIDSGALPPGLSMSKGGLILGKPTTAGKFQFWANLIDPTGKSSQRPITIAIEPEGGSSTSEAWEKPGWKLTFFDEFDIKWLDQGHWAPAYQGSLKMPANFIIQDGLMHIRMDRPPAPPAQQLPLPRPEKTGRVSSVETQAFFMQQYGLFEVRARMPSGDGLKGVIWMSPVLAYETLKSDGGTRPSADEPMEIDMFEQISSKPNAANVAVHYGKSFKEEHQAERQKLTLPFSLGDDFHVYALQWDETALVWYVDGKEVHRSDKSPHTPLFLRLSVFEDEKVSQESYPQEMQVDYVRIYQPISEDKVNPAP
jgi:beta-glucanase (GH16 family)